MIGMFFLFLSFAFAGDLLREVSKDSLIMPEIANSCYFNWVYGYSEGEDHLIGVNAGVVSSAEACQQLCQESEDCTVFLWASELDRTCYLKSAEKVAMATSIVLSGAGTPPSTDDRWQWCNMLMDHQCHTGGFNCHSCEEELRCIWQSANHIAGPRTCPTEIKLCDVESSLVTTTSGPAPTTTKDENCYFNWVYGYSEGEDHLIGVNAGVVSSADACQQLCQESEDCTVFLWAFGNNAQTCYLKSAEKVAMATSIVLSNEELPPVTDDRWDWCNMQMDHQCHTGGFNCHSCEEELRCIWQSANHIAGPRTCPTQINLCDVESSLVTTTECTTEDLAFIAPLSLALSFVCLS